MKFGDFLDTAFLGVGAIIAFLFGAGRLYSESKNSMAKSHSDIKELKKIIEDSNKRREEKDEKISKAIVTLEKDVHAMKNDKAGIKALVELSKLIKDDR